MAALLRASTNTDRRRPRRPSSPRTCLAPARPTQLATAGARSLGALLVAVLLGSMLAVVGLGTSPDPAAADPLGTITNHGLGVRDPVAIAPGPDGNLWFASIANDAIGRVTPAGAVTMYAAASVRGPRSIVAGADGNLWFTNSTGNSIGRITPAGVITDYTAATIDTPREIAAGADGRLWFTSTGNSAIGAIDPTTFAISSFTNAALVSPLAITAAPDGNLWVTGATEETVIRVTTAGAFTAFTDPGLGVLRELTAGPDGNVWFTNGSNAVGKVTPTGVVTAHTSPSIDNPQGIATGPDGALWFTNIGSSTIGRVTTAGVVSTFTDATVDQPYGIVAGPDGHVWFTNRANNSIGHIDPTSHVIGQAVGSGVTDPDAITDGPDGNLWFTNFGGASIGRITPAGVVTTFSAPGVFSPAGITRGPDGNLWFTNLLTDTIGRITPAGAVTIFSSSDIDGPWGITAGPDGNLWFTNAFNDSIGTITPSGVVTRHTGAGIGLPTGITTGADGNLWFANRSKSSIGRIDPTTFAVVTFTGPAIGGPQSITAGPDGNLWFTNNVGNSVGRITPAGAATAFTDPSVAQPHGITSGPDGNLWFTSAGTNRVGRVTTDGGIATFAGPGVVGPRGIAAGADGNLWFTNANSSIGSVGAGPAAAGLRYHPQLPVRVLDSRTPTGGWNAKLQAGAPRTLHVPGTAGVPADAEALVLNVTATESSAPSFLTVYPSGGAVPTASNLNFAAHQTIPNLVTVPVGAGGDISFATAAGATDVVADLVGWFGPSAGERFNAVDPTRILDSRGPTGGWGSRLAAGAPRDLTVTGVAGVPATASAVTLNVTATNGSAGSFLTLFPAGVATPPTASNVNFAANETIANLAVVQVGAGGAVRIANAVGSVDVVVDVVGYYDAGTGDLFHPLSPTRVLDSRGANGGWGSPLVAGAARPLTIAGARGIPSDAHAVAGNVTVTNATTPSFLTVSPAGGAPPNVSNLNFAAGQTIPNHVAIKLGAQGAVSFRHAAGSVDVVFDLVGYYAST